MAVRNHSKLFGAIKYKNNDAHLFCRNLIKKYIGINKFYVMVEIGGSVAKNAHNIVQCEEYYNLDLKDNPNINTIVCDCTKEIPLASNSVDFVFSNDAFEHLQRPWITGEEISRILKKDGIVFIGTLFSWRYHPVPEDYYRYTPSGLCALFPKLKVLEANFCDSWRRDDIRGFWKSGLDDVPIDMLGGWRENWKVYYFGQK